jgi:nucleoside-diphosphate-sugar epimerase
VSVFTYNALINKPVTIWGKGEVSSAYFYVEDISSALLAAREIPFRPDLIFNLDGMQEYTLNQLVYVIEKTLGVKIQVRYEQARSFDVPELCLDTAAATAQLGWKPTTTLEEGVLRTAEWIERWID